MQLDNIAKGHQGSLAKTPKAFGIDVGIDKVIPREPQASKKNVYTPHLKRDTVIKAVITGFLLILGVSAYILLRSKYTKVFSSSSASLCCVISCLATIFWSFHILPLDITSLLLIPILVLSNTMTPVESTGIQGTFQGLLIISKILVSPVILLLMGSCLLSTYFQNNNGSEMLLPHLMSNGNIDSNLFRTMFLALVLSSVMSNITAPIIITSILQNTLKAPHPAIIMGIAMASNIGGMVLPISSPQSILGSNIMNISWVKWLWVSIPTSAVCFLFVYTLILCYFPKGEQKPNEAFLVNQQSSHKHLVIATLSCIICWAVPSIFPKLQWIYALPVCALLLAKNSRRVWNRKTLEIVSIAVAGTAIGKSIERTKMLEGMIAGFIIDSKERSFLFLIVSSSFIMLIISCIVCHTVSAVVLLPIFEKIGMYVGRPRLIIGICSLVCSCGMAFPSSGFPNILSSSFKSESGKRLIDSRSFITIGAISTLACYVFILTVSLFFMVLGNF